MPKAAARPPGSNTTLSPRQEEVLVLVGRGLTNGEIAEKLGISLDGVKWHLREVFAKYGVDSRDEAVAAWRAERGGRRHLRAFRSGVRAIPLLVGAAGVAVSAILGVAVLVAYQGHHDGAAPSPTATVTPRPVERILTNGTAVVDPATVVANGTSVAFRLCATTTSWYRPSLDEMEGTFTSLAYGDGVRPSLASYATYLSPFVFLSDHDASSAWPDVSEASILGGLQNSIPEGDSSRVADCEPLSSAPGRMIVLAAGYHVVAVHVLGQQWVVSTTPDPSNSEEVRFRGDGAALVQFVDASGTIIAEEADGPANWHLGADGQFESAFIGARSEPFPVSVGGPGTLTLRVFVTGTGSSTGAEVLVFGPDLSAPLQRVHVTAANSPWVPAAVVSLDPGAHFVTIAGLPPGATVLLLRDGVPLP